MNQPSGFCEWYRPPPTFPPLGARTTIGTDGASAVPVAERRRLVDDLIEAARDEVGELHLGDRPVAAQRGADADADDRRLGNRRVDDAQLAELVVEPLRDAERAAVRADVLAEDEHFRIAPHLLGERFADGFEVGQFFGHGSNAQRRAR